MDRAVSAVWLGLGGAALALDRVELTFVPLLLGLLPLAGAALSARWLVARREVSDGWVAGLLARPLLRSLGWWWLGYAVVVAGATGLAALGPVRPVLWTLLGPALVVPTIATAVVLAWEARSDEWLLGPRLDGSVLPVWLRRAVVPALRGAGLLIALGAVLVVALVALNWDRVATVQTAVGGGGMAAAVLWVVQGAALPNLSVWAISFLAGPGFSVVDGASTTWSGTRSGLLPLVPVLGALPQPQAFPWFMLAVVLAPVVCGGIIGRWGLDRVARLSSLSTKMLTAGSAAAGAGSLVVIVDLLGGSSLGAYRLSAVGAPAGWLLVTLVGELVAGAVVVALWDAWRLRR